MFWQYPLEVHEYSTTTEEWSKFIFTSKQHHVGYIQGQFKVPGEYYLRNTYLWKETGNAYTISQAQAGKPNFEGGKYHPFTAGSAKHNQWKLKEREKILNGVMYDGLYIPPFYHWYLNFCPIYDDALKMKRFGDVWDSDFWYMQYCMLAILQGKHIGGVKGRQKGYSYKHMAILYWSYCWFESSVNTIGAYDEKLVKKSWRFLEGYRAHINTTTTWRRGPTIPKSLEWNEYQMDENNTPQGNMAILKGVTFKQSTDNDVGGSTTFFNYEEPGVSPTILETLEFVRPSLEKGSMTTGIIIACGSVGNLDDADGLNKIFYNPEDYNFLGVKNIWDENADISKECCIFISEAYNMLGHDEVTGRSFFDKEGNSDVELALTWIKRKKEQLKNSTKSAELKQLAISQKCISPSEAFKERKISEFPVAQLRRQQERILLKDKENKWEYKPQKGLLEESSTGSVILNSRNPPREHEWPIKPDWEDKRGVWTIYEPPDASPELFTYFAAVDAIEVDVTETSSSVASIDIFKTAVQISYQDKGKVQTRIEGDKLVANYRGRFDTAKKTNEQMWLGIKMYNAFVYAERNKPNFINYMRENGRAERYLAKESDVPVFKDLNVSRGNIQANSKFGFHKGDNTEVWKYFKAAAKEYFFAEYDRVSHINKEGVEQVFKTFTGIDRIDDYWLLEEFCNYVEGKGNYDRLVSFMAALFICKIYQQNRMIKKKSEVKEEKVEEYIRRPISLIGGSGSFQQHRRPQKLL